MTRLLSVSTTVVTYFSNSLKHIVHTSLEFAGLTQGSGGLKLMAMTQNYCRVVKLNDNRFSMIRVLLSFHHHSFMAKTSLACGGISMISPFVPKKELQQND